jgi:hypothetical protein
MICLRARLAEARELLRKIMARCADLLDEDQFNALNELCDAAMREQAPPKHCQNGNALVCLAGNRDGICCPEESCDIDDGLRAAMQEQKPPSPALARLALAREWINTRVPHLEECPWRGLTRDAQGLLPDCRCGRDALLAALEVPRG